VELNARTALTPRQRHDLVGTYVRICLAAEGINSPAHSGAGWSRVLSFADEGVVACHLEFDLGLRQEAELVADILWDGDLSFGVDPHHVAHAGKCNCDPSAAKSRFLFLRIWHG